MTTEIAHSSFMDRWYDVMQNQFVFCSYMNYKVSIHIYKTNNINICIQYFANYCIKLLEFNIYITALLHLGILQNAQ